MKCRGKNPPTLISQAIFKNNFVKTCPFEKMDQMHRLISTWLWLGYLETYISPLITVFSSHLEGSILCKAIRSSAGVRGEVWVRPSECVPSNLRMKKDKQMIQNSCNWTQHAPKNTMKSIRYFAMVSFPNCSMSWKCQIFLYWLMRSELTNPVKQSPWETETQLLRNSQPFVESKFHYLSYKNLLLDSSLCQFKSVYTRIYKFNCLVI